jgi:uncharacterized protein (TIGR03086 family)
VPIKGEIMSNQSVSDLERALEQAQSVLSGVAPSQLGATTPCAKWNVKDLSNHMVGGTMMFGSVTRGETMPDMTEAPDFTAGDIVSTFDAAKKSVLAAWQETGVFKREMVFPFATLPAEVAARVQMMEVVIHTWDLAQATGQVETLDDSLAETVLSFAGAIVPETSRNVEGEPFGFIVAEPDSASPYAKLAGLMGRNP